MASTEGKTLVPKRSVLIVDRSPETQEVLRTALGRRGVRTLVASRAEPGLELARQHRPDLIVLDLELEPSSPEEVCAPFARQSREQQTPLLMLGTLRCKPLDLWDGQFVPKPYYYGPLIRKIEEILGAAGRTPARGD